MKTKTAMQELIENLETKNKDYYKKWKESKGSEKEKWNNAMSIQTISVMVAKKLLAKEKQDIIDARLSAPTILLNNKTPEQEATDYFTQKYEQ